MGCLGILIAGLFGVAAYAGLYFALKWFLR